MADTMSDSYANFQLVYSGKPPSAVHCPHCEGSSSEACPRKLSAQTRTHTGTHTLAQEHQLCVFVHLGQRPCVSWPCSVLLACRRLGSTWGRRYLAGWQPPSMLAINIGAIVDQLPWAAESESESESKLNCCATCALP